MDTIEYFIQSLLQYFTSPTQFKHITTIMKDNSHHVYDHTMSMEFDNVLSGSFCSEMLPSLYL